MKPIPDILKDHILPFNWDVRRLWAIEADVVRAPCSEFAYLLELPLWSSVPRRGLLFDTRPIDVIRDPAVSPYQAERLQQTELQHPIDVLIVEGRRWILDGVHRIARHFMLDSSALSVRFHGDAIIPAIRS